jgi:hypothetical protein
MGDLRNAQACTIGNAKRGFVLDARCSFEQLGGLLDAEDFAHLVRAACRDQRASGLGAGA